MSKVLFCFLIYRDAERRAVALARVQRAQDEEKVLLKSGDTSQHAGSIPPPHQHSGKTASEPSKVDKTSVNVTGAELSEGVPRISKKHADISNARYSINMNQVELPSYRYNKRNKDKVSLSSPLR